MQVMNRLTLDRFFVDKRIQTQTLRKENLNWEYCKSFVNQGREPRKGNSRPKVLHWK